MAVRMRWDRSIVRADKRPLVLSLVLHPLELFETSISRLRPLRLAICILLHYPAARYFTLFPSNPLDDLKPKYCFTTKTFAQLFHQSDFVLQVRFTSSYVVPRESLLSDWTGTSSTFGNESGSIFWRCSVIRRNLGEAIPGRHQGC
ncbi:hypothetical protein M405DRAFT_19717 [Rhizopogon salebrosus TDB-379]|nr:hypothetical protein M405DRAFT_19717 [Rhizopogon salebrosus TDB-379]